MKNEVEYLDKVLGILLGSLKTYYAKDPSLCDYEYEERQRDEYRWNAYLCNKGCPVNCNVRRDCRDEYPCCEFGEGEEEDRMQRGLKLWEGIERMLDKGKEEK